MSEGKQRGESEEARKRAHARAWELARRQGVKPVNSIEDLKGDFWPEDESIDDFLSWLHDLRQGINRGTSPNEHRAES